MKYIKTYENYKTLDQLKKYIVSLDNDDYYLDEIVGENTSDPNTIDVINYYYYNEKEYGDEIMKSFHNEAGEDIFGANSSFRKMFLKYVVFTSDDFEESYDYFIMIIKAKKYNL